MKETKEVSSSTGTGMTEFLSIKSKTWTRDSHGLFDYESSVVKENILLIQKDAILYRRKHELKEMKDTDILTENEQKICDVKLVNSKFLFKLLLILS